MRTAWNNFRKRYALRVIYRNYRDDVQNHFEPVCFLWLGRLRARRAINRGHRIMDIRKHVWIPPTQIIRVELESHG